MTDTIRLKRRGDSESIEITVDGRAFDLTSSWADKARAMQALKRWRDEAVATALQARQKRAKAINGNGRPYTRQERLDQHENGKRIDSEGHGH